jgi:hypothetical protein
MRRKPQLRNGLKLAPRTPGNLLSGAAQDLLVQLFNAITSGRVEYGSTLGYRITDNNLLITIPRTAGTGGGIDGGSDGGSGGALKMFKIHQIQADYLVCLEWDGTNLGSTFFNVAKPTRMRLSNTSEWIDGRQYNYSYQDSNNRVSNDGVAAEREVLFPRYVTRTTYSAAYENYSVIWATECVNGTGVSVAGQAVTWLEVNPMRVWARRYIQ